MQSREGLLDDPQKGYRHVFGEGEVFVMPIATSLCSFFPSSLQNPPEKAFMSQKHLATQKTFSETGNALFKTSTQRPKCPNACLSVALTPTHISKLSLYLDEKEKRSFFILFSYRSKGACRSWFPQTGNQEGMLRM